MRVARRGGNEAPRQRHHDSRGVVAVSQSLRPQHVRRLGPHVAGRRGGDLVLAAGCRARRAPGRGPADASWTEVSMLQKAVIVRSANSLRNEIEAGPHRLIGDEPVEAGGTGAGPTPYDFLNAALGTCTSMTIHVVAQREKIPVESIEVRVSNDRMYAKDCADCTSTSGYIHRFTVEIKVTGPLTPEQRERVLAVAKRCPVAKTLTAEIRVDDVLVA